MKPAVVLLHGLGRTERSLGGLRRFLEDKGHETWSRTYPSRKLGVAELAATVAEWIRGDLGERPVIGITHSLGGILARHMAAELDWRGLLMLAPPNSGSRVAAALSANPIYRWFFGPAGQELADASGWPEPPRPFAVIAGTGGATVGNIPSWLVKRMGVLPPAEPHDGTVAAAETRLPGMVGYAEVPASHTWLMNHPRTRELVLGFIERGRFDADAIG